MLCASLQGINHVWSCANRAKVPLVVISIVIDCVLTLCAFLLWIYDFQATRINVQRSLILEFMCYDFGGGHNATEATKNICGAKGEDVVYHSTLKRMFKKFRLGRYKNVKARLVWPKSVHSDAVLKAIDSVPMSSIQRVSGEISI